MTGPEIRAVRHKLGLSRREFALLLGIGKRTLERVEAGGEATVLMSLAVNHLRTANEPEG